MTLLKVFCHKKKVMNIKEIQVEIQRIDKKFPAKDVRLYVYRLVAKGLLKQPEGKKYQIVDNMFREYLISQIWRALTLAYENRKSRLDRNREDGSAYFSIFYSRLLCVFSFGKNAGGEGGILMPPRNIVL